MALNIEDILDTGLVTDPEAKKNSSEFAVLPTAANAFGPKALVPGSVTSRALYSVWTGDPLVIVDSPPGAGKTETIATISAHLSQRSDPPLSICVVTPNRDQTVGVANRIATQVASPLVQLAMSDTRPEALDDGVEFDTGSKLKAKYGDLERRIVIRTLDSLMAGSDVYDVMVVDEAYQAPFTKVAWAASRATQILLVGDPGQIGPVVSADDRIWKIGKTDVALPAPVEFRKKSGVVIYNMDKTYRLGQRTAAALAPLYDFAFTSHRPHREVIGLGEIEAFQLPVPPSPFETATMGTIAAHASAFVGKTLRTPDGDRAITMADIAVVVSRRDQMTPINGALDELGFSEILVGTANSLQGGEWPVVVAVDPLLCGDVSAHATDPGRLCVMASRHSSHLSWFHDGTWEQALKDSDKLTDKVANKLLDVRYAICEDGN